jgi:hypothetical protein
LLAVDSPAGLQKASEQTATVTLEATAPRDELEAVLRAIDGVRHVAAHPIAGGSGRHRAECQVDDREGLEARIARAVVQHWELHRLERQQPTLENVFLRYVAQGSRQREAA